MSEEIEETRRELKIQESFVYQLAETNTELESESATQVTLVADAKDRGRALLRDDSVRTSKRHNLKTREGDTANGPQQQGQVMLDRRPMFLSQLITASDRCCVLIDDDGRRRNRKSSRRRRSRDRRDHDSGRPRKDITEGSRESQRTSMAEDHEAGLLEDRDILHHKIKGSRKLEFGLNTHARLPDAHPEKTYRFLLRLIDRQLRTDREDYVYDKKEKSVKNLLSGNKNAAPAEKNKAKGKGGNSGKEDDGNTAAPVLPKAKAKDYDKKGKGKGKGSMRGEKESAQKGISAKNKRAEPANPKASAPAPNAKQQAKAQAKPKAAAPAIVKKVHIAMPAITVKRAATSETKKDDKEQRRAKPKSRLCITTVMQKTP